MNFFEKIQVTLRQVLFDTVWLGSHSSRVLFVFMVLEMDEEGFIWGDEVDFSEEAFLTMEEVRSSLNELIATDKIKQVIDGNGIHIGYKVIDYIKFSAHLT